MQLNSLLQGTINVCIQLGDYKRKTSSCKYQLCKLNKVNLKLVVVFQINENTHFSQTSGKMLVLSFCLRHKHATTGGFFISSLMLVSEQRNTAGHTVVSVECKQGTDVHHPCSSGLNTLTHSIELDKQAIPNWK